jgi:hypothetical protein
VLGRLSAGQLYINFLPEYEGPVPDCPEIKLPKAAVSLWSDLGSSARVVTQPPRKLCNAYLLWRNHRLAELREAGPRDSDILEDNQQFSQEWKNLSADEKRPWQEEY